MKQTGGQLKYMEMKVCNEETVNKLGSIMSSFIRDLDKPTEEKKGDIAINTAKIEAAKEKEDESGGSNGNDQQQTMNGSSSTPTNSNNIKINKSLVDTTATISPPSTSTTISSNNNVNTPPPPSNSNNNNKHHATTYPPPPPPTSSSDENDNKLEVDFSAKSYSRKKSLELKTTFSQKQRHVSEIIKLMNDKGVGGIDLKGVNVEAL